MTPTILTPVRRAATGTVTIVQAPAAAALRAATAASASAARTTHGGPVPDGSCVQDAMAAGG